MDRLIWHLEDLRIGQCYPNYYVSQLASKFVKVVMCGAGGDELFGGYPWRYAAAVGPTHEDYVDNYYAYWKRLVRNRDKPNLFNADTAEALRQLDDGGELPFEDHTLSMFRRVYSGDLRADTLEDQINQSFYFECKTFLHGVLLVEDKLSMSHSLETRVPFLDNELVDFACRVPSRYKLSDMESLYVVDENDPQRRRNAKSQLTTGKSILRDAMANMLPPEVTRARKQGFSAPDESWFRGRSEFYVRDVLQGSGSKLHDFISPEFVSKILDEHSQGLSNRRLLIWSLLSFEKWLRRFASQ